MAGLTGGVTNRRRLGRGIQSLIDEGQMPVRIDAGGLEDTSKDPLTYKEGSGGPAGGAQGASASRMIALDRIVASPFQPRSDAGGPTIASLAGSIRARGVIQPVVVRPAGGGGADGRYELIAGERRWRAARLAGLQEIPAVVLSADDATAAELALVENLHREDLNPIDRARGLAVLVERFGQSHAEAAQRVGMDRSSVTNLLRLLELEASIRELIAAGRLGAGHGKALLSVPAGEGRVKLAREAAAGGWSVRRLEAAARRPGRSSPRLIDPARQRLLGDIEAQLGEHLGTRVRLRTARSGTRGRIVIEFYDLDHFDAVMSRMGFALT